MLLLKVKATTSTRGPVSVRIEAPPPYYILINKFLRI